MKTLKFTVLILTMLTLNGCNKDEGSSKGEIGNYQHMLWLSFQDASGNDLIEGSEFISTKDVKLHDTIPPEYYTLEYVYEKGIPNPWKPDHNPNAIYNVRYPRLYLAEMIPQLPLNHNYNYLWFDAKSVYPDYFAEKIIFRLACPYIFGDNEAHDIVTWWERYKYANGDSSIYGVCYRIEYDDKEFTVEERLVATIIVDR